jgi:hypothetical protein
VIVTHLSLGQEEDRCIADQPCAAWDNGRRTGSEIGPMRRTPWDTLNFALAGAIFGMVAGATLEISEVLSSDTDSPEPLMESLLEIGVGLVAGALLFAVVSIVRNRIFRA